MNDLEALHEKGLPKYRNAYSDRKPLPI